MNIFRLLGTPIPLSFSSILSPFNYYYLPGADQLPRLPRPRRSIASPLHLDPSTKDEILPRQSTCAFFPFPGAFLVSVRWRAYR